MDRFKDKKERTVVHLQLLPTDEHFYFGSIANIYEFYDAKQLGITYGALRNYGLSSEHPYKNNNCIIRKGALLSKTGNRGSAVKQLHSKKNENEEEMNQ